MELFVNDFDFSRVGDIAEAFLERSHPRRTYNFTLLISHLFSSASIFECSKVGYWILLGYAWSENGQLMNDIQPIFIDIFSDGLDEEGIEFTAASRRLITAEASGLVVWDVDPTVRDWLQQWRSRNGVINDQKSDVGELSEKITNWWELKILCSARRKLFYGRLESIDAPNTPLTLSQSNWLNPLNPRKMIYKKKTSTF